MKKATSTLIAAVAALAVSGSVYAQNNTLATPSTVSPVHPAASGYGTPGATTSESGTGAGSSNAGSANGTSSNSATSLTNLPGSHNTLATPSTVSPAGQ
ncbi:hypothetical protein [Paraburkholderia metrosideri]|jgi:hypothetical protein|uniref:Proteophosphoglycan ppg4 n=1 Tax=Paraburkholderia metrosideri TaxID=580937 RepID=A0ABN7HNU0_9BURK|nr:hypothetical protein [Paraburkholderia metrosideri]CAD6528840.1 hypothetical protein LMG28140_02199 [Paraburkholderia metrosideri]